MASPGTLGNLVAPGEDAYPRRFENIERALKELGPSIAESLRPIIQDLQDQQAALTAQVASIAALVNTQVSPTVAHGDVNAFSLATGPNVEKVRVTISVPTGYTRALVYATATMVAANPTATSDDMYLQITVNGGALGYSAQTSVPPTRIGTATKAIAGLLTGASGSFYVNALASSWAAAWTTGTADNYINLDVMVLFLR